MCDLVGTGGLLRGLTWQGERGLWMGMRQGGVRAGWGFSQLVARVVHDGVRCCVHGDARELCVRHALCLRHCPPVAQIARPTTAQRQPLSGRPQVSRACQRTVLPLMASRCRLSRVPTPPQPPPSPSHPIPPRSRPICPHPPASPHHPHLPQDFNAKTGALKSTALMRVNLTAFDDRCVAGGVWCDLRLLACLRARLSASHVSFLCACKAHARGCLAWAAIARVHVCG